MASAKHPSGRLEVPAGIQVGLGSIAVLIGTIGGAVLPASDGEWRAVPVALAILALAMVAVRGVAVVWTAALGFLLVNGFLVNQFGQLSWHGYPDAVQLILIATTAGVGFVAGVVRRHNPSFTKSWLVPASAWPVQTIRAREDIRGV